MSIDLNNFSKSIYSQSGEDGILEKLFDVLNIKNGWCCEFGAGNGLNISNTLNLRKKGWGSVLIEGSANHEISLMQLKNENTYPMIKFISCEEDQLIDKYLSETPIPINFDLLSIDIDGNDLWVWKSIVKYNPKVVIIEYNSNLNSLESKTIVYDPLHVHNLDNYFGATASALYKVGKEKGYDLVGFTLGLNLIFCKKELSLNLKKYEPKDIPISIGWGPSKLKNMIEF